MLCNVKSEGVLRGVGKYEKYKLKVWGRGRSIFEILVASGEHLKSVLQQKRNTKGLDIVGKRADLPVFVGDVGGEIQFHFIQGLAKRSKRWYFLSFVIISCLFLKIHTKNGDKCLSCLGGWELKRSK